MSKRRTSASAAAQMRPRVPALLAVFGLLCVLGCSTGPDPMYEGPAGKGTLVYKPGVGITRDGAQTDSSEQATWTAADKAFREGRWDECITLCTQMTLLWPEGSRIVDALLMRVRSNLEAGRSGAEGAFSRAVPINQWMMLYLAPDHDSRIVALFAKGGETRETLTTLRSLTVQSFIDRLAPDADTLYNQGRLNAAQYDVNILTTYYLPTLQLREYRQQVIELARDVCWLMYASREFSQTIEICEDLLAVNPPPGIKGDTLFIMGSAQRRNGAAPIAAQTFGWLYRGAGLRDTDTRWRPFALLWQIHQTMATSKGFIYDLTYYERALELIGEYEIYRVENTNIPKGLHEEFLLLATQIYDVMIRRELNAADTYSRVGERKAAAYHEAMALEWEQLRDKRIASLGSQ